MDKQLEKSNDIRSTKRRSSLFGLKNNKTRGNQQLDKYANQIKTDITEYRNVLKDWLNGDLNKLIITNPSTYDESILLQEQKEFLSRIPDLNEYLKATFDLQKKTITAENRINRLARQKEYYKANVKSIILQDDEQI